MKHYGEKIIKPVLFFVIIAFASMALLFVLWSFNNRTISNGSSITTGESYFHLIADSGSSADGTRNVCEFSLSPETAESYSLVIVRAKRFVLYTAGGEPYLKLMPAEYQRIRVVPLDARLYNAVTQILHIEWETSTSYFLPSELFLCPTQGIVSMQNTFSSLQAIWIGMLLMMLLFSLILYYCKPEEVYLLYFSLYTMALLLIAFIGTSWFGYLPYNVSRFISAPFFWCLQMCVSIPTCYRLLDMPIPRPLRPLLRWYGVLGVCFVYTWATGFNNAYASEIPQLIFILLCAYVLTEGCSAYKKGAWILLFGYALRTGFTLVSSAVNLGLLPDWPLFVYLRSVKLIELPFEFACMFCINHRFADKFKESERLSKELSELNRSLDQKVEIRTNAYIEQRERRHNMMLNIFHDLRSPLFTLRGCAELMSTNTAEDAELAEVMKERIGFLSNLTEDLFLLAKLEDEELIFACENTSLSDILCTVVGSQALLAEVNGICLGAEIQPGCNVWGNTSRLTQAFENLVANALHYTPTGGKVNLNMHFDPCTAVITVTDTGKGIKPDDLDKIFMKYYTTSGTSSKHTSTGLGLSIAKNIIERHRGSIRLSSEVGKGSTFTVYLPVIGADG